MEPAGIVGLVASCVGLGARAVASAKELDDFITSYRAANKSVAKLANQLRLFAVSVEQLEKLLDGQPTVSDQLKNTIRSSMRDCDDIIGDLEEHVKKVISSSDGSKGLALTSKIRLLWSQSSVGKEEQTLHRQLQTVMLLISLVRENDAAKQNSVLGQPGSRKTFAKSARDARSIREGKDTNSISTSISSSSRWSSSTNTEVEFDIDEEILKSGPYVANYRALLAKSMTDGQKPPSVQMQPKSNALTPKRLEKKTEEHGPKNAAVLPKPVRKRSTAAFVSSPRRFNEPFDKVAVMKALQSHRPGTMKQPLSAPIEPPPEMWHETQKLEDRPLDSVKDIIFPSLSPHFDLRWTPFGGWMLMKPASLTGSVDEESDVLVPLKTSPEEPKPNFDDVFLKKLMDASFPPLASSPPWSPEKTKFVFAETRFVPRSPVKYFQHDLSDDEDLNDLCDACEEGNFKWAKYLLEEKTIQVNGSGRDPEGKSPLHLAVETGRQDIVDLLLDHSARPNILDKKRHTPFLYAIERVINDGMSLDIARSLVSRGASLSGLLGPRPLVEAISRGHLALAEFLLEVGEARDLENEVGEHVFSIAVASGRVDLIKLLLEYDYARCRGDRMGREPLLVATMRGRQDIVQLLMQHNVNQRGCDHDGYSPINYAVKRILESNDDLGLARLVVRSGTLHAPNGCPLILMAVAASHLELVKLLIKHSADCDQEWDGLSPLGLAVKKRDLDMVSALVHLGKARIDKLNKNKTSPLLDSVRRDDVEMVSSLLETEHEPICDAHSNCPQTPLSAACCKDNAEAAKLLLNWEVWVGGLSEGPLRSKPRGAGKGKMWFEFGDMAMESYTPLHVAARVSPGMTRLLLDAEAAVMSTAAVRCQGSDMTIHGVTPLHLAIGPSAEILITDGRANVFSKDSRGRTPLFWAAGFLASDRGSENLQAVEANLAQGAPVNLRDRHGLTSLYLVAEGMIDGTIFDHTMPMDTLRSYISIARTLLAAGAKTNICAEDGTETIKDIFTNVLEWSLPRVPELRYELEQLQKDLGLS
ncbi:hypothetical protein LRP88_10904 [Fusarium phalaenopsidis]